MTLKALPFLFSAALLPAQTQSEWAYIGADHHLHYKSDAHGNHIMDFSSAGYRGGGVRLPAPPPAKRLSPIQGDNTAQIQAALNDATGAVVLAAGEYEVAGTLSITRSSVVLRGEKGATIRLTAQPHRFLDIRGAGTWSEEGPSVPIVDAYVPSGADSFHVKDASAFHAGDRVLVQHPVSAD